ncbi:MFS transporter [Bacillus taeanensis]|uniref:MFS transporter n=2 Tax=Bacillus taeanensis TaxID=273032 RepID=A0A366XYZ2_9BACI|nr:MFS transporter [Bacillus taeanensis]
MFLFFFHSAVNIIIGFLPVYFQNQGLSGSKIGLLLAIGPFAAILSQPFWGYMSDKYNTVKRMILICLIGLLVTSAIFFQMNTFVAYMIMGACLFYFMSPIGALGDSLAQKTSRQAGVSFGSIRTWGSIGFALTALVGGQILSIIGVENMFFPFAAYALVAFFVCWKLSDIKTSHSKPVTSGDALKLVGNKRLLTFLALIMFITITHRTNDSFVGLYVVELGGKESLIGWAWFVGVASEALIFALSAIWFRRFHVLTFIIISGILYTLRWFLFAGANNPGDIILFQAAHGITFAVMYVAAMEFVSQLVPEELQGTGQLLFISVFFGLSGIIGSLGGGIVMDYFNGTMLYQTLSCLALVGSIGMFIFAYIDRKHSVKYPAVSQ